MHVIALFGPTGVGKTAVAVALAGSCARAARIRSLFPPTRCRCTRPRDPHRGRLGGRAHALEHRLVVVLADRRAFSAGEYAELAHAEIDALLAAGRRPIVVGGTGLYLRAALAELDLRPPPPEGDRERWPWRRSSARARLRCTRELARARRGRQRDRPERPPAHRPRARAARPRRARAARGPSQLWSRELRHPTLLVGLTMEREALYARIDAGSSRWSPPARARRCCAPTPPAHRTTARKALGFDELLAGDVERMKRRTRNYARRQLDLDAQARRA